MFSSFLNPNFIANSDEMATELRKRIIRLEKDLIDGLSKSNAKVLILD